jgi:hypothetical protein
MKEINEMKPPIKQNELYFLYTNVRDRLYAIIKERNPDPVSKQIRSEMAEELLEYLNKSEQGLNAQIDYKQQWIAGEVQND